MVNEIVVRDVIEQNDCAGKKYFYVTSMEGDETVQSRFRLTHAYMIPHEKLILASVAPQDKVLVVNEFYPCDLLIAGTYVHNLSDVSNRDPLCRCGTPMVSDGFDIYCPNDQCPLTLTTRFERLGMQTFSEMETLKYNEETGFIEESATYTDLMNYIQPFAFITNGLFWGYPGGSLEHILLTRSFGNLSLATFLVEPLLRDFIEQFPPPNANSDTFKGANIFYRDMDELIQRRDLDSVRQNVLLRSFLSALGIESLSDDHIRLMVQYEHDIQGMLEPFLLYAYLLTHPGELMTATGMHRLEAATIMEEVRRRRYELFDIFYHYTNNNADVVEAFKNFM